MWIISFIFISWNLSVFSLDFGCDCDDVLWSDCCLKIFEEIPELIDSACAVREQANNGVFSEKAAMPKKDGFISTNYIFGITTWFICIETSLLLIIGMKFNSFLPIIISVMMVQSVQSQFIWCTDYKECGYGQSRTTTGGSDYITCGASFSCDSADTISSQDNLACSGSRSCANVSVLRSILKETYCLAFESCVNAQIPDDVYCKGLMSCSGATITAPNSVTGSGEYSLSNSTTYNVPNIYFYGYMAGFGSSMICTLGNSCTAHCRGTGCVGAVFSGDGTWTKNTVSDESTIDLEAVADATLNDATCLNSSSYDGYRSRKSPIVDQTGSVCCRGVESCRSATSITMNSSTPSSLVCSGGESCIGIFSGVTTGSADVICAGSSACMYLKISTLGNIYCIGFRSCYDATITTNGDSVRCAGDISCSQAIITISAMKHVAIYFTGYYSGQFATIACVAGSSLDIFCEGFDSCSDNMVIQQCNGSYSVHCAANSGAWSECGHTHAPTMDPTIHPTMDPTIDPTIDPTTDPTIDPTVDPTTEPTFNPTTQPTFDPTKDPTSDPTIDPTIDPTTDPTIDPTVDPTTDPTNDPTSDPTFEPTMDPTTDPTKDPTKNPTTNPTAQPTAEPTRNPTNEPTVDPTIDPTIDPTNDPTNEPTVDPTIDPTIDPTNDPTIDPTLDPTIDPTNDPTIDPTIDPTKDPTTDPTIDPTTDPTIDPTNDPTTDPTIDPTTDPSKDPTADPSIDPTTDPTIDPTTDPTIDPTIDPTEDPTIDPTVDPTVDPTNDPTSDPTIDPTVDPTVDPTTDPSLDPTITPTMSPSMSPTLTPSSVVELIEMNVSNKSDTYNPIIYIALLAVPILMVLIAIALTFTNRKSLTIDKGYKTKYGGFLLFFLQVFDVYSDGMFTIQLFQYYTYSKISEFDNVRQQMDTFYALFLLSFSFTLVPYVCNIVSSFKIVSKIISPSNKVISSYSKLYFENRSSVYSICVLLSGGSFPTLKLLNSTFLSLDIFCAGLSKKQIQKYATHKILLTTICENIPQCIIQSYFIWNLGLVTDIVVISFLSSVFHIVLSILIGSIDRTIYTNKQEYPFTIEIELLSETKEQRVTQYLKSGSFKRLSQSLRGSGSSGYEFEILSIEKDVNCKNITIYGVGLYNKNDESMKKNIRDLLQEDAVITIKIKEAFGYTDDFEVTSIKGTLNDNDEANANNDKLSTNNYDNNDEGEGAGEVLMTVTQKTNGNTTIEENDNTTTNKTIKMKSRKNELQLANFMEESNDKVQQNNTVEMIELNMAETMGNLETGGTIIDGFESDDK